jgi:hypothetical protein
MARLFDPACPLSATQTSSRDIMYRQKKIVSEAIKSHASGDIIQVQSDDSVV